MRPQQLKGIEQREGTEVLVATMTAKELRHYIWNRVMNKSIDYKEFKSLMVSYSDKRNEGLNCGR